MTGPVHMLRVVVSVICFLIFPSATDAQACFCVGRSIRGAACESAWSEETSAVFLGKVVHIVDDGMLRVELRVEESYLGDLGRTIQVTTTASEATCGYHFVKGERYLVYARDHAGTLFVSYCSRTRPAKYADEDIAYLRSLPTLPPTATVFGSVWRYTHDPNFNPTGRPSNRYEWQEQDHSAMVPMPGMTVVVTSSDGIQHLTTVGSDGEWTITDLPPGTYDIDLLHDDSMYVRGRRWHVKIAPRSCARDDIRIESNGGLTGVLSHFDAGADWTFLTVFALPAGKTKLSDESLENQVDFTNPSFELSPLPAGRYVLGAYVTKTVHSTDGSVQRQLAPTFYPGVTDLKAATVLDVPDGKMLRDLYFTVMPTDFLPENWGCLSCDRK